MVYTDYNTTDHLTGTMFEFGRYSLSYQPPEGCVEAEVDMSISSEATLPQMLELFESFLKASGYVFDGSLVIEEPEVIEKESPTFCNNSWSDFWNEDGMSVTGNPAAGPDTINFGAAQFAGMWGGMKDDTITLG
jgi:hypothetical protein